MKVIIILYSLIIFIILSCSQTLFKKNSTSFFISEFPLINFVDSIVEPGKHLSISCRSQGYEKMINSIDSTKYYYITVKLFSGFLGYDKDNEKRIKYYRDLLADCIKSNSLKGKKIKVENIGEDNYIFKVNTTVKNLFFEKSTVMDKKSFYLLDKNIRIELNSIMNRVEIYGY